ncbi:MAG: alkaline phosphatase D family protein [Deltaproteobacteria bacterium]|nr:alkaline phosphatase D family protein [Deltaproteobacteria bacterium]
MKTIVATTVRAVLAVGMSLLCACATAKHSLLRSSVTHGVIAGEVTQSTALLWGRCDRAGAARAQYRTAGEADWHTTAAVPVAADHDFTATLAIDGLRPDTPYEYRVSCRPDLDFSGAVGGVFHTAPSSDTAAPITFLWSGDVGGQNVCRDRNLGYPIFAALSAQPAEFFVALGDMIYGDDPCRATGRYGNTQIPGPASAAGDVAGYWAYWKYNREDDGLRHFLGSTATYAVWDDHEVRNDFGPLRDTDAAGRHLMPFGLQAFRDYNPLAAGVMYRRVRWGKQLEIFFLDTRSYRDPNDASDAPQRAKTMLGAEQREWLKAGLSQSTATWKVVVSSVPLSIPSGKAEAHDGWANGNGTTGFENELLDILRFTQRHDVRNQLWITTDVHFASVQHLAPFADAPSFELYEVSTGPLHAGVFPDLTLDPTLRPQRLFVHPTAVPATADLEEALTWFNFGQVTIAADGRMRLLIRDVHGQRLYELDLSPR